MKKILCTIAILSLVLLTGCKRYSGYSELTFNELQAKLENKDSFVFVIGSSTCSACAKYQETMKDIISDKQVEIFYLDLKQLSEEEYAKVYSKYVIVSTPTTIFVKNGLETSTYDRIVGAAGYSDVVKNLEKHGFIGE